ncbi:MAG: InlB B-repeat-containing protein [Lachnospiraceae bacterium]|nr:InlB B-repeat-containing protein [Lachnospiraceae bacterium]
MKKTMEKLVCVLIALIFALSCTDSIVIVEARDGAQSLSSMDFMETILVDDFDKEESFDDELRVDLSDYDVNVLIEEEEETEEVDENYLEYDDAELEIILDDEIDFEYREDDYVQEDLLRSANVESFANIDSLSTARTLTVSPPSVSFASVAANRVINVTSNGVWNQPTRNVSWLTISNVAPANRTRNGSFRINVTANTGTTSRSGTITIRRSDGAVTRTISVTQAGRTLTVSPTSVGFAPAAANRVINVTSNGAWNQPASNAAWLTISNVTPASRSGNGSFRINVSANLGLATRSGTITIRRSDGAVTRTISVTQTGRTLTVSPTSVNFGSAATNRVINLTSNGIWNQPTSNAGWLTISNVTPANRNGNGSFRINASANMGSATRSGTVTIRRNDGAITRTISVTQVGRTLTVSPTSVSFGLAAANRVINVTSNGVWNQPTSNVGWLTISNVTPANRNGNGSFRINATANTGTASRSGTITIRRSDGAITRTISVIQAGRTLAVSPTSVSFGLAAANRVINVTSNGVWNQPTSNVAWLTISNVTPANRNGNGSFRINATANTGTASRSGTITIRRNDGFITRTISVNQVGRTLTVSPTSVSFNPDANNRVINVTTNGVWNQPTSNVGWLTISNVTPASRNGNGSFRINATANTGTASRSGIITIRRNDGSITRTISVTQAGRTLTVSSTSVSLAGTADNRTINVTSNATWNNPTSNATWLTISNVTPVNRSGNGSFRINVTANTGPAARTGMVTVTSGGITRNITVTQPRNVVTLTFNPNGGSVNPTTRNVTRGDGIGANVLPTPTRANRHFVDWFNTSATSGGTRIRTGATFNSDATLWARWTDPSRHLHYWTRPANTETTTIILRNFSYNMVWQSAMERGIENWNRSDARVDFSKNATSNNRVSVHTRNYENLSALGTLTPIRNGTNLTNFDIRLFSEAIVAYANENEGATVAPVIESVMTHELGHAIGLRDNPLPNTRNGSIMNSSANRQRWIVVAPTQFDETSVNMIY